jgi:hypothetical protein
MSQSRNSRTSRHTFSHHVKARGNRARIGSTHVNPRSMPVVIIFERWLADGSHVAVARSNDVFVAAHLDADENPIQAPVRFTGGQAHNKAMAWAANTVRAAGACRPRQSL